jgi:hypothetical protein
MLAPCLLLPLLLLLLLLALFGGGLAPRLAYVALAVCLCVCLADLLVTLALLCVVAPPLHGGAVLLVRLHGAYGRCMMVAVCSWLAVATGVNGVLSSGV